MIAKEHYTKFDYIHIVNILLLSVLVTFCYSVTSILKKKRFLFIYGVREFCSCLVPWQCGCVAKDSFLYVGGSGSREVNRKCQG